MHNSHHFHATPCLHPTSSLDCNTITLHKVKGCITIITVMIIINLPLFYGKDNAKEYINLRDEDRASV